MQYVSVLAIIIASILCFKGSFLSFRLPFSEDYNNRAKAAYILSIGAITYIVPFVLSPQIKVFEIVSVALCIIAIFAGVASSLILNRKDKKNKDHQI